MSGILGEISSPVPPPSATFNFAQHIIERNSGRSDQIAYVDEHERLTYGKLEDQIRRAAAGLLALGVRREERVLFMMQDCIDWPVCFLGAMYVGIVPVIVDTSLPAADYADIILHSRSQSVIVSEPLLPTVREALKLASVNGKHEVQSIVVSNLNTQHGTLVPLDQLLRERKRFPDPAKTRSEDPGFWIYAPDQAGHFRAAVHSHASPYWCAELYGGAVLGLTGRDVCFSTVKLHQPAGLSLSLLSPLSFGAATILMAKAPNPENVLRRLRGRINGPKPNVFSSTPASYGELLASPQLAASPEVSLRLSLSGGGPLPIDTAQRFRARFGCDILEGLGAPELLHAFVSSRPGEFQAGAIGWPVPGYDLELRGSDGQPVADGQPGDLYVSGPSSATMYWRDRSASHEAFIGCWTRTGHRCIRNPDGSFAHSDAADTNSSGEIPVVLASA